MVLRVHFHDPPKIRFKPLAAGTHGDKTESPAAATKRSN
jgi:hypothetical protein